MRHLEASRPRPFARPAITGRALRPVLVIVDDGVAADLLLLPPAACGVIGDRFEHRGGTWTITGFRAASRALVAEPVGH